MSKKINLNSDIDKTLNFKKNICINKNYIVTINNKNMNLNIYKISGFQNNCSRRAYATCINDASIKISFLIDAPYVVLKQI